MSTVHLTFDSASPNQAYNLTLAFQRTSKGRDLPGQITALPTVAVLGAALSWTSPRLFADHAAALLAEYDRLERGIFEEPASSSSKPTVGWDEDRNYSLDNCDFWENTFGDCSGRMASVLLHEGTRVYCENHFNHPETRPI